MDRRRLVEIVAPQSGDAAGRRGSGYLLDARFVLTAGHVVEPVARVVQVRPLGSSDWVEASCVWKGEAYDAAVLELAVPLVSSLGRVP
jgi:hypothetical protein